MPIFHTEAAFVAPVKILLVPGHDNVNFGARYGNTKEADMNLRVATQIFDILKQDKRFDVYITRDDKDYTKEFADFLEQKNGILAFELNAKDQFQNKINKGGFVLKQNTPHHAVSEDIALRLYGFNKWANENKMDAMIHVHFNDYPRKTKWTIGRYKGFTIYVPDSQFLNAKKSAGLAENIFAQLHKKYITSTWKPESAGIVPDQKLIAVGANNTLESSVRSVLVEYGYIYEKKFQTKSSRLQAYKDMAILTVNGINNYFFGK